MGAVTFAGSANPGYGHTAIGLVLLAAVCVGTLTLVKVDVRRSVVIAVLRAVAQLTVVALLVRAIFASPYLIALLLAVMLTTATLTTGGRLRGLPGARFAVLGAAVVGAVSVVGICFAVPVVPREARYVVALGGITLGGTMVACTLAGRAFLLAMRTRQDEIEAWLSIGATPRQACAYRSWTRPRRSAWYRCPAPSSERSPAGRPQPKPHGFNSLSSSRS
jgi:putative ABC transport system permease protein